MKEPLSPPEAKALIRQILVDGTVSFTGHAEREMSKDQMAKVDVENVLRGGAIAEGEWENGSWRYRAFTNRMAVVVSFRAPDKIVVITAWRNTR